MFYYRTSFSKKAVFLEKTAKTPFWEGMAVLRGRLLGEIDIFTRWLFCGKFNSKQPLCRQIWDVCGNTFFTCWRSASYWNSIELVAENSKWDASLPFEYELGWTAFLASGTPEKWISRGKMTEKWFSRLASWPSACKKTNYYTHLKFGGTSYWQLYFY